MDKAATDSEKTDGKGEELDLYNMSDDEIAKLHPDQLPPMDDDTEQDQDDDSDDDADDADAADDVDEEADDDADDDDTTDADDDVGDDSDDDAGDDDAGDGSGRADESDDEPGGDRKQSGTASKKNAPQDDTDTDEDDDKANAGAADRKSAKNDPDKDADKSKPDGKSDGKPESKPDSKSGVDFEKEHGELFAPFKANGRDMQVRSVDEARTLMQQGANYNKKMLALKPHLRTVKTLEREGIDDTALNYLIDLHKKDPAAISKLVKDSGINPEDMDVEEDSKKYKPGNHGISDQEFALDSAIDDIKGTPTYQRTIQLVGNQWDAASKDRIGQNPAILGIINDHMASGVYEVIQAELDRQRALGQLNGLNDLDAYKQVGDGIQEQGGFAHLFTGQGNLDQKEDDKPAPTRKRLPPKRSGEDPKLNARRKAAGAAKHSGNSKGNNLKDFNPLGMSDEEFERQFSSHLQ